MARAFRPGPDGRLRSRPVQAHAPSAFGPGLHPLEALGLPEHLLLVPAQTPQRAPLVVWFHGAGGSGARSLASVRSAADDAGCLVLLPSSRGSTWDLVAGGLGPDVAALDAALQHVFAQSDISRVALAGFSDGASYALSLGLASGDLAQALLAFSPGFVAPPELVGRPRCWVAHGSADTVLPLERCGRRVAAELRSGGYEVRYEEFVGGHVVPPDLLRTSLSWWLDDPPT